MGGVYRMLIMINLRKSLQSAFPIAIGTTFKKRTQPLRPYKSVLICAPDNYRGCVVCASYQREPIVTLKSAP